MLTNLSDQTRYSLDAGAVIVAWLHFFQQFWSNNVGTMAASLSVIWLGMQIWTHIKQNYFKKKKKR